MADVEPQDSARDLVSALIVPFALPPAMGQVRTAWDFAAQVGVVPHVTILFPFVPCADLVPAVRLELAAIAAAVLAFEVRFERVRRFPALVWVEPDPAEPFAALTAAVVRRWPEHPPYGGEFETVIPHMTVVESRDAPLDEVDRIARRSIPFSARADRLELWCQDAAGRWRPRWRMPFGVRP